jgi:hypothetical protein
MSSAYSRRWSLEKDLWSLSVEGSNREREAILARELGRSKDREVSRPC